MGFNQSVTDNTVAVSEIYGTHGTSVCPSLYAEGCHMQNTVLKCPSGPRRTFKVNITFASPHFEGHAHFGLKVPYSTFIWWDRIACHHLIPS